MILNQIQGKKFGTLCCCRTWRENGISSVCVCVVCVFVSWDLLLGAERKCEVMCVNSLQKATAAEKSSTQFRCMTTLKNKLITILDFFLRHIFHSFSASKVFHVCLKTQSKRLIKGELPGCCLSFIFTVQTGSVFSSTSFHKCK